MRSLWRAAAVLAAALAIALAPTLSAAGNDPNVDLDHGYEEWTPEAFGDFSNQTVLLNETNDDSTGCAYFRANQWSSADGTTVLLYWVRCPDGFMAGEAQKQYWSNPASAGARTELAVLANQADKVLVLENPPVVFRGWVQGAFFVAVTTECPSDTERCIALNEAMSRDVAGLSSEPPGTSSDATTDDLTALLVSIPIATWLLFVAPWRLFAYAVRSRRASKDSPPGYRDLTRVVRYQWWLAFAKPVVIWLAAFALLATISAPFAGEWLLSVVWATLAAALIVLRVKLPRAITRAGRPYTDLRSPRAAAGVLLQILARALVVLAILVYLAIGLIGPTVNSMSPATVQATYDNTLAQPFGAVRVVLFIVAVVLANTGSFELLMLGVVLPSLIIAHFVDRLGRRLRATSARRLLETDPRPHILYLRSFDEDKVRMPATLTRRGLFERLSPVRSRRFEEVLVQCLTEFGPVIALSPPGTTLAALGAAKLSLDNAMETC